MKTPDSFRIHFRMILLLELLAIRRRCLWFHGENSLHNFVRVADSIHPRIKLELRYSPDSIEFLDVRTSFVNGYLKTDLFTKDTD
jgi:hypothetical protein